MSSSNEVWLKSYEIICDPYAIDTIFCIDKSVMDRNE